MWASLIAQMVKNLPEMQETGVRYLGQEDTVEKEMATHSCILAWETPWTEKPGELQSVGLQPNQHHHQAGTHSLVFELCSVITFGSKQIYFSDFSGRKLFYGDLHPQTKNAFSPYD